MTIYIKFECDAPDCTETHETFAPFMRECFAGWIHEKENDLHYCPICAPVAITELEHNKVEYEVIK